MTRPTLNTNPSTTTTHPNNIDYSYPDEDRLPTAVVESEEEQQKQSLRIHREEIAQAMRDPERALQIKNGMEVCMNLSNRKYDQENAKTIAHELASQGWLARAPKSREVAVVCIRQVPHIGDWTTLRREHEQQQQQQQQQKKKK